MKNLGMNYNDYVQHLMDKYGMNENDAERQADCDFDLLGDSDLRVEPVIDLMALWEEAEDRIEEKLMVEGELLCANR